MLLIYYPHESHFLRIEDHLQIHETSAGNSSRSTEREPRAGVYDQ